MATTADLLLPTLSASRTRAKRSRPAGSLETEGKGKVQRLLGKFCQGTAPVMSVSVLLLQALSSVMQQALLS